VVENEEDRFTHWLGLALLFSIFVSLLDLVL
jgi:hypothetical protein